MSEIIKSGTLHMSLGENFGDMYTDMVREIAWYECKREKAIVMLMSTMSGMRVDHAESIIDGTMKLKTIEDGKKCSMIKDNWKSPKKEIEVKKKEIDEVLAYIQLSGYEVETNPLRKSWFTFLPEDRQLYLWNIGRGVAKLMETNIWEASNEAKYLKEIAFKEMKENSVKLGEPIMWNGKKMMGTEIVIHAGKTGTVSLKE